MKVVYLKTGSQINIKSLSDDWDIDLDDNSFLEEDEVDDDIFEERNESNY